MLNKIRPKSEFSRNVLTLMTGTTIAQAIPIAISPILTRLYSPEDFGLLALYMSVFSLVVVMATGRYELAVMLPKKNDEAKQIAILSFFIALFVSLVTLVIVTLFNRQITNFLGNEDISDWLYFMPISVLAMGIYQSLNYWNNRNKEYKLLTKSKVLQSSSNAVTSVAMGFANFGAGGLILGLLLGQVSASTYLAKINYKEFFEKRPLLKKLKSFALLKKYKKMPLLNLPNAFIDNIRLSGINILIMKYYSAAVLGQFSLAWRMVQAPFLIIGSSLSQVFFQKATTIEPGLLTQTVKSFLIKLVMIAIIPFLIIYFYSADIFIFVFGEEWYLAGQIASVMTPWLFLNFLTSPVSSIFIVLNKQEVMLYFSIVYMFVPLMLLAVYHNMNFLELLNIVTLSMGFLLLIFIGLVLYYVNQYDKQGRI